jgi:hypothetical protein
MHAVDNLAIAYIYTGMVLSALTLQTARFDLAELADELHEPVL